jgi:hypothetical protein
LLGVFYYFCQLLASNHLPRVLLCSCNCRTCCGKMETVSIPWDGKASFLFWLFHS